MTCEEAIEYATAVVEQWKDWVSENSEQYQFYKLSLEVLEKVRDGKMIELPCKVGAEIFILMIDDEFPNYVDLGTVEGLSYQADGVWIFARYECGLTYWHPLKDLGKEFFLDPYEAEKALKEREEK